MSCEGNEPPLTSAQIAKYIAQVSDEWEVLDNLKIRKRFKFKNFMEAIGFVNRVAEIAEEEGHHPDMIINYNRVTISLTTHAIGGLSQNDFIMAAKIDNISV